MSYNERSYTQHQQDQILRAQALLWNRVSCGLFGTKMEFIISGDRTYNNGRLFIQASYFAPCTKTGERKEWKGRKWYLSDHMTDDEIVKTAYCAFKAAVEHEMMEGFKVDGVVLFNPHVNFEELLRISGHEIKRKEVGYD